jgi:hypothetical protein
LKVRVVSCALNKCGAHSRKKKADLVKFFFISEFFG